ncbi:MAG: class I SAM-dependent methyltransferase [Gammaproteobacteria bacterium]|nr:class I SAM-dependent methyltransferase [Gammaproteobacteria bacterium]
MEYGQVSQTALKVATTMITLNQKPGWRNRLPEGLAELSEQLILAAGIYPYTSRLMRASKRAWAVRLSDLGESFQPGTFEGLGERKIFMNEQVLAAIAAGATQVLVVGAGFDTLCLRLAPLYPGVQFVEVDHPATGAVKARAVAQVGQPGNMTLIAADLGAQPLSQALADCAVWNPERRSGIVAEGLLYYLAPESVHSLFQEAAACTALDSRFAFSHLTGLSQHGFARAALQLFGEPWLSASTVKELPGYIGPGWQVIETRAGGNRDLEGFAVAESYPRSCRLPP